MRQFLSDFITTLSSRRQVRVGALLEESRVDKDQLENLAQLLATRFGQFTPMRLTEEGEGTQILAGPVALNFRDTVVRLSDLYNVSNIVSVLLESHAALLSSEVKALEDELVALDKMASNYAFLLSDSRAFDYAYLEPFSDETGRETSLNYGISDRAGLSFGPAEAASILPDEGVLTLPEQIRPHGLTGAILKGNASSYMRQETPFEHLYTPGSASGWVVTVQTPGPVTAALPEAPARPGVQLLLEFTLTQPAPATQVKLVPLANQPVELLKATLYASQEDATGVELLGLGEIRVLDRPHTLFFPMQTTARVRILINQPIYERRTAADNATERDTWAMLTEVRQRRSVGKGGLRRYSRDAAARFRRLRLSQFVREFNEDEDRLDDRLYRVAVPRGDSPDGVMRPEYMMRVLARRVADKATWAGRSACAHVFYRMGIRRIPDLAKISRNIQDGAFSELPVLDAPVNPTILPVGHEYTYRFGLAQVAVGVEAPGFKGMFISRPFDAPGDIGEVRIKASHRNYRIPYSVRSSPLITSVEYSVTNRSNPRLETDWVPILPVDSREVEGERFLPDIGGRGYLRFPADPIGGIHLYRNGMDVAIEPQRYLTGASGRIVGLTMPTVQYGKDDVFTVSYVPAGDPTTVSFEASGYGTNVPLVNAFDSQGAGEGYALTLGRHEADLRHQPYVDPVRTAAADYSRLFGLIPYQPLVVRTAGGATAINLTNYQGGEQAPLPDATQGYYYLHSGRTLIFNQKVEDFRVFYQYLQNTVRFRVVLRVNNKDFVAPTVDYVHLKAKTRRPNTTASI